MKNNSPTEKGIKDFKKKFAHFKKPAPAKGWSWRTLRKDSIEIKKPVGNRGVPDSFNQSVAHTHPHLLKEFYTSWNNGATLKDFKAGSSFRVFWKCAKGHVWYSGISSRTSEIRMTTGCPMCSSKKASKENNISLTHPEIADEWCYELNGEFKPDDFSFGSTLDIAWICKSNPDHVWPANPKERSNGNGCPLCYPKTSRQELFLYAELVYIFGEDKVIHQASVNKREVDILINDLIGIEFNGSYWHSNKFEKDIIKLKSLENSGVKVIRVQGEGLICNRELDISITKKEEVKISPEIVFKVVKCLKYFYPTNNKLKGYIRNRKICNSELYEELIELPKLVQCFR